MNRQVYLTRCDIYELSEVRKAVRRIFDSFGGAAALCGGKRVLIKPNLLLAFRPEAAATTHPAVVQAVAEELLAAGCTVTLADSAGGPYTLSHMKRLYAKTGMEQVARDTGVILHYGVGSRTVQYPAGKLAKSFQIIDPVADAEFIVDIAKMKTHGYAYYTGAVKNMFGAIPGLTKPLLHSLYPERESFCSMLVDLCCCTSPSFSIIDGVVGMEGHGPSGGSPKAARTLIGAVNPHAADLAAVQVMGLRADLVPTLVEATRRDLIPRSYTELELLGEPVENLRTHFVSADRSQKARHPFLPPPLRAVTDDWMKLYPQIKPSVCAGCGDCMRTCPQKAISIINRKAVIDYTNCIRCYCCHELCTLRAIRFKRRFVRHTLSRVPSQSPGDQSHPSL